MRAVPIGRMAVGGGETTQSEPPAASTSTPVVRRCRHTGGARRARPGWLAVQHTLVHRLMVAGLNGSIGLCGALWIAGTPDQIVAELRTAADEGVARVIFRRTSRRWPTRVSSSYVRG